MIQSFLQSCSVVDVESTSPKPSSCEIIELAFSIYTLDWNCISQHYKPSIKIPSLSSELHFINDAMVADKPSFAHVADAGFFTVVDACDYYIAHNARFDKTAILNNLAMHNINPGNKLPDDQRWICTFKLAKKLFNGDSRFEAMRLSYLWFELGLWETNTKVLIPHQADSDIYMAGKLFEHLLAIMIDRGIVDLSKPIGPQVIAYQNKPTLLSHFPFGKHKGVLFADVPTSYLTWAVGNLSSLDDTSDDYDEDLTASIINEFELRGI